MNLPCQKFVRTTTAMTPLKKRIRTLHRVAQPIRQLSTSKAQFFVFLFSYHLDFRPPQMDILFLF